MAEKKLRDRVGRPAKNPDHPLYRLFEERKVDKNAFAEALGIYRQHLDAILRGDYSPGKKLALKMSKLLGIPLEEILFPKVPEKSTNDEETKQREDGAENNLTPEELAAVQEGIAAIQHGEVVLLDDHKCQNQ